MTAPVGFWYVGIRYTARTALRARVEASTAMSAPASWVETVRIRLRGGGGVDRARECRILDEEQLVGPQVVGHHEADRLLRAGRYEELALVGGQAERCQVSGDGPAERRVAERVIAVIAREPAGVEALHRAIERVAHRRARRRHRAHQVDGACRRLGQPAEEDIALERGGQLRGVAAHERGVGARDLGSAALPPVHDPLLAQQAVRGDHGSAPDPQLPRQRPLGRQGRAAEQRARLDRRPTGRRPAACRAARRRPASLRAPAGDDSHSHDWTRSLDLSCRHEQKRESRALAALRWRG